MRVIGRLIRGDMPQFFEPLDERVIARDRLEAPVRIDKVSPTIADMSDGNLLPEHKRGSQCGPATRGLTLDRALCFTDGSLHDLLEGFVHRIGLDVKEIGMELAQDIARHGTDGRITRHFSKLVATHAISDNIESKRQVAGIARHHRSERQEAVLVKFPLLPHRLPTTGNQLLQIETRVLIADNSLYLLL